MEERPRKEKRVLKKRPERGDSDETGARSSTEAGKRGERDR